MYRVFEYKDNIVRLALLIKPTTSAVVNVVQEAVMGTDSKIIGIKRIVIDKDSKEYLEYQVELK